MNLTIMKKIILVTGATDGIGLEAATALIEGGHHVLLHGRNESKLQNVMDGLGKDSEVETFCADLSRLADVEALASEIRSKHSRIDVLINNAGILKTNETRTPDGLDVRFAVNTVAPYLLTKRLIPSLMAADHGKVINLSSAAQNPVDAPALHGKKSSLADFSAYAQSKLAITMWNNALAAQYRNDGIAFVAVNPGSMLGTKMVREGFGASGNPVSIGRDILVKAALKFGMPDSGKYFDNDRRSFGPPHPDASDMNKCKAIVEDIEALLESRGIVLANNGDNEL